MAKIGVHAARTHLPALLERVARGETITITHQGAALAVLAPPEPGRPLDLTATLMALEAFRDRHSLPPAALHTLIDAGRSG